MDTLIIMHIRPFDSLIFDKYNTQLHLLILTVSAVSIDVSSLDVYLFLIKLEPDTS